MEKLIKSPIRIRRLPWLALPHILSINWHTFKRQRKMEHQHDTVTNKSDKLSAPKQRGK